MVRLPTPGSDDDIWGDVLNQYLLSGHNSDGSHNIKAMLNVPNIDGQMPVSDTSSRTGFVWQASGGGSNDPVVGGDLSGTAGNAQIVSGAVGTNELAATSVTAAKIASTTITDGQISTSAAIAQSKIANLTTDLASKVSKAGDVMSGSLAIQPALIAATINTFGVLSEVLYGPSTNGATRAKAVVGRIVLSGGSNLTAIASQIGVEGLAESNNTGTTASLVAVRAQASNFSTGTVTELTGIEVAATTNNGGGTVANAYGVLVDTPVLAGGASTGAVSGVYVRSQTGATSNYAIYTQLGTVRFGDMLDMSTNKISNLADPTNAQEAVTKAYADQKARKILPYSNTGTLTVLTGTHRIYNDSGQTWTIISVRASVGTAPTGASVIIDVNKNGTTIFSTQANRPTIAVSGNTSGLVNTMSTTSVTNGEYLTIDIDQIGSTIAGGDLTLQVEVL
jgi:hypothetical protein